MSSMRQSPSAFNTETDLPKVLGQDGSRQNKKGTIPPQYRQQRRNSGHLPRLRAVSADSSSGAEPRIGTRQLATRVSGPSRSAARTEAAWNLASGREV